MLDDVLGLLLLVTIVYGVRFLCILINRIKNKINKVNNNKECNMDDDITQKHREPIQSFNEFYNQYGIVAGIILARAKKTSNARDTWFQELRKSVPECPDEYLEMLWQKIANNNVEPSVSGDVIDVGSPLEIVANEEEQTQDMYSETIQKEINSNRADIKKTDYEISKSKTPNEDCLIPSTKNEIAHKTTLGKKLSLIQRFLLVAGIGLFIFLCLNPPYSQYRIQNGNALKSKFIGHVFYIYANELEHDRFSYAEIDVRLFILLSSAIIITTGVLLFVCAPRK